MAPPQPKMESSKAHVVQHVTRFSAKPYQETSLEDALILHPIAGDPSTFTGQIHWDWAGMIAAHGGILVSLILAAARKYSLTQYPSRDQPDPLNSHIQFLHPVPIGPIRLHVTALNLGSRISVFQVSLLSNPKSPSDKPRLCTMGIITQGNLASEKGISLPTGPSIRPEDIPSREECVGGVFPEWVTRHAPVMKKNKGWYVSSERGNRYSVRFGRHVREAWYERGDGRGYDVLALGQLLDAFPAAPSNYFPDYEDSMHGIVYPTLSQTSEIKKDPAGAKWLFLRLTSHEIKNGRFDTDGVLIDELGEVVALTKHVSLITEQRGKAPIDLPKVSKL